MLRRVTREPFTYTPKDQRGLEDAEQIRFILRPLSFAEREAVETGERFRFDKATDTAVAISGAHALARKVLNHGLVGWEGAVDAEFTVTRTMEGGASVLTEEILDAIEPWAVELTNAITERSSLDRDTRKN